MSGGNRMGSLSYISGKEAEIGNRKLGSAICCSQYVHVFVLVGGLLNTVRLLTQKHNIHSHREMITYLL